ncbi:MAG: SDR family NAD(P)-dependent oxidoreductase [Kofleriaceae bacterium]|nr:SDR family NAD(P)-dependent oxidoreductase [Kofleriaceae bacterium]MCB9570777.1 SDR family NAD(P)-dependent oxidoreductase [Kofleriaceae bacterium]
MTSRILITGAARGIGAALAHRMARRGARVALLGLEPEHLARVARDAGDAPWRACDVTRRDDVDAAVAELVATLGGLDVVVANAGVAAQLPLVGGDPEIFERTIGVNVLGTYYTLRAAGPHVAHAGGYALAIASLAAAVHLPLMGAYCASKAAVEALGNSLRTELAHTGARVGVAYFGEIDTDMTARGFGTRAAAAAGRFGPFTRAAPLATAVDALERGLARRSRTIWAPGFVGPLLPVRALIQRVVDVRMRRGLDRALAIAREEHAGLTTAQPA